MELIDCPKTMVGNYYSMLRDIPEDIRWSVVRRA